MRSEANIWKLEEGSLSFVRCFLFQVNFTLPRPYLPTFIKQNGQVGGSECEDNLELKASC